MRTPSVSYYAKFPADTFEVLSERAEKFNCKLPRLLQIGVQTRETLERYRDGNYDGHRCTRDYIGGVLLNNLFETLEQYPGSVANTNLVDFRLVLPEDFLHDLTARAFREGFPSFDHYLLGGHLIDMADHGENLLVAAG